MSTDYSFDLEAGEEFDFYGVDGNCFKLDDTAYEAVEDEVQPCEHRHTFHSVPIARVVVEQVFSDDVYELTDLHDGQCWLRFGIEYHYLIPEFIFDYTPRNEVPLD